MSTFCEQQQRDVEAANTIAAWLARRDLLSLDALPAIDMVLVCGSSVLATVHAAVEALARAPASCKLLISGGHGHSTAHLFGSVQRHPRWSALGIDVSEGRSEAAVLADLVLALGVRADKLLPLETASQHCGGNAEESRRLVVERLGMAPQQRLLLIQDPTMQQRTHASFARQWPEAQLVSWSPLLPQLRVAAGGSGLKFEPTSVCVGEAWHGRAAAAAVTAAEPAAAAAGAAAAAAAAGEPVACAPVPASGISEAEGLWGVPRFLSLLLGEVPRLRNAPGGYGPAGAGFIAAVAVPPAVEAAHAWLAARHPALVRA